MNAHGQGDWRRPCARSGRRITAVLDARGYAMAALLVAMAVMGIMMSMALPAWRFQAKRERELELIFRGEQYARAVALFQRKYAGAFPPSVDVLLEQKYLRKKYKDPITGEDFQVLHQGDPIPGLTAPPNVPGRPGTPGTNEQGSAARPGMPTQGSPPTIQTREGSGFTIGTGARGGVVGVVSRSKAPAIIRYKGRSRHNEWVFTYTEFSPQGGAPTGPGMPQPGMPPGGIGPRPPGTGPGPGINPFGPPPGGGRTVTPGRPSTSPFPPDNDR